MWFGTVKLVLLRGAGKGVDRLNIALKGKIYCPQRGITGSTTGCVVVLRGT